MRGLRTALAVGLLAVATTVMTATPAGAETSWEDAGVGVGAAFANLLYIPAKLLYAGLGSLSGGLAYVCTLGNEETADAVWTSSLGGTYVLTPSMLRGEDEIAFSGTPHPTAEGARARTTASAPAPALQEQPLTE